MNLRIAYQGVAGAYSHIASRNLYPDACFLPCPSFAEAFALVQKREADLAVIPVENSNAGRVSDVHFLLPQTGLSITGEYFLRIKHQLLGLANTRLEQISKAFSHPQALAQCSEFLKTRCILPCAENDTALSCQKVLERADSSCAAIASELAAETYGLKILAANIENAADNTTRFLIMSPHRQIPEDDGGDFITSFIFRAKNIPAALYKALGGFATNGINMTKLESYLLNGRFVSAQFYVEIESHPARRSCQNAFTELKFFSDDIHMLGTYPAHPYRKEQAKDYSSSAPSRRIESSISRS